jgi:hypothetical protein
MLVPAQEQAAAEVVGLPYACAPTSVLPFYRCACSQLLRQCICIKRTAAGAAAKTAAHDYVAEGRLCAATAGAALC